MPWTDNPVADFHRYCDEQERQMAKLPRCCECEHPITDEYCFEINGEYLCEQCLHDNHRKHIDDFIE